MNAAVKRFRTGWVSNDARPTDLDIQVMAEAAVAFARAREKYDREEVCRDLQGIGIRPWTRYNERGGWRAAEKQHFAERVPDAGPAVWFIVLFAVAAVGSFAMALLLGLQRVHH